MTVEQARMRDDSRFSVRTVLVAELAKARVGRSVMSSRKNVAGD
jgi:hypothetical protein